MTAGKRATILGEALALTWRAGPRLVCLRVVLALAAGGAPVTVAWCTKLILDRLGAGAPIAAYLWPVVALAAAGIVARFPVVMRRPVCAPGPATPPPCSPRR